MKNKLLLGALVFCVLSSIALYNIYKERTFNAKDEEVALLDFETKEVTRIRIMSSGKPSLDVSRSNSLSTDSPLVHRANWVLKDPTFAPASDEVIGSLIGKIKRISGKRQELKITEKLKEEEYGLLPPELVLIVTLDDGAKEVISFGSKSKISGKRYLQKEDNNSLFVTHHDFPKYYSRIKDTIKSREVLKIDPEIVSGVDIIEGDSFFRLINKKCEVGSNEWNVIASEQEWRADNELVERKIRELSLLKVNRIIENVVDVYSFTGLDNPFLVLNINFHATENEDVCSGRKKELLLQFGKGLGFHKSEKGSIKTSDSYFLKIAGETRVYEIEKSFLADWLLGGTHFRTRKPFDDLSENLQVSNVSYINPQKSCSVLINSDAVKKVQDKLDNIIEELKNIQFKAIIQEQELVQYDEINGLELKLKYNGGNLFIKEVAKIKPLDPENKSKNSPIIVSVTKGKKEKYSGVVINSQLQSLRNTADFLCEDNY